MPFRPSPRNEASPCGQMPLMAHGSAYAVRWARADPHAPPSSVSQDYDINFQYGKFLQDAKKVYTRRLHLSRSALTRGKEGPHNMSVHRPPCTHHLSAASPPPSPRSLQNRSSRPLTGPFSSCAFCAVRLLCARAIARASPGDGRGLGVGCLAGFSHSQDRGVPRALSTADEAGPGVQH